MAWCGTSASAYFSFSVSITSKMRSAPAIARLNQLLTCANHCNGP